jgi:hypothetical protein
LDKEAEGQTGTFNRSRKIINIGKKYTSHRQMEELWKRTEQIVLPFLEK